MKILITGATGTVGNEVGRKLFAQGHDLVIISRSRKNALLNLEFPAEIIEHDLVSEPLAAAHFKNVETIIHLMGESIDGRWTEKKKNKILDSRKLSSVNLLKNISSSVHTVISASAQGIYGDQGDQILTESAAPGKNFLASVCEQWEAPFVQLAESSPQIRTVQMRIGLVLDPQSGALRKMIPLFQKGFGGVLGSGRQFMSWIALEDLSQIFVSAVSDKKYKGPLNCVAQAVTNVQWTESLARAVGTFKSLPVPSLALKAVLGEMAEVVLASVRMSSEKLEQLGFKFAFTELENYFTAYLSDFKHGAQILEFRQFVPHELGKIFPFFAEAQNLESLTPDILNFKVAQVSTASIEQGTLIDYNLKIRGVPVKWKTLIEEWNPPNTFVDTQIKGPYALWRHHHTFEKMGQGTLLTDRVQYKLPLGFLGQITAGSFVQKDVESIFQYRREVIGQLKFK